jgi:hypothetical protein
MSDQSQPVEESEFILRRIHRQHYQEGADIPVLASGFRPTQQDTTGISVFRERFLAQTVDALASLAPEKQGNYFLARLAVEDLRKLDLTVVPDPDYAGPPGHAVIPELSWQAYQQEKARLKEVHLELAKLASSAIVHKPSGI